MITIYIKKQEASTNLFLFDSEGNCGNSTITTQVKHGDKIVWKLAVDSGIDEITNIYKKSNSQDIFSTNPTLNSEEKCWEGMIDQSSSGSEGYNIEYKVNGITHKDDPELEIHDGDGD